MNSNPGAIRLALLLIFVLGAPFASAGEDNNGVRYYVSLGTSLSIGIQPDSDGINQPTADGYADQLHNIIEPRYRKLRLVKIGCAGETSQTMIAGGICRYSQGSQLDQAVRFLRAHKDKVALVTIDIGVNDILADGCITGTNVNFDCINGALAKIANNLPTILTALREAADPSTRIVGMNYYNTFLAAWLAGDDGKVLAMQSAGLASILNYNVLQPVYDGFGIAVADVATAFRSDDFSTMVPLPPLPVTVPLNVASICLYTYMCVPAPVGPNIHATREGYGLIAATFAVKL